MVWFTYVYLGHRFVLLDVTQLHSARGQRFIASVSAAPEVCFEDSRPDRALLMLVTYLRGAPAGERSYVHDALQAVS